MIGTPAQLTAYLQALATNHPLVALVITGEGSRSEAATRHTVQYPLVKIETPSTGIPASMDEKSLYTRLYIITAAGNASEGLEDREQEICYRIAEDLVMTIQAHASDSFMGLSLTRESIEIEPVISVGSDQTRGWTFELSVLAEKDTCASQYDLDRFFMPQFSWMLGNDNAAAPEINTEDQTIGDGVTKDWYYREQLSQPAPAEFFPNEPLELEAVSGTSYRLIEVWLKAQKNGKTIWSYSMIDTRFDKGASIPFIPSYPE